MNLLLDRSFFFFSGKLPLVCLFGSSVKKISVGSIAEIRGAAINKYPELKNAIFKLQYRDEEVNRFVDVDEDDTELPPGSEIRIEMMDEVLVNETVVDESETQFDGVIGASATLDIVFDSSGSGEFNL